MVYHLPTDKDYQELILEDAVFLEEHGKYAKGRPKILLSKDDESSDFVYAYSLDFGLLADGDDDRGAIKELKESVCLQIKHGKDGEGGIFMYPFEEGEEEYDEYQKLKQEKLLKTIPHILDGDVSKLMNGQLYYDGKKIKTFLMGDVTIN